jgi:nucleotide-binding universal stress UspA family protein
MSYQIRRILVPTDFSEPSDVALELAIEMARRFSSELELFHAQELPAYVFPDGVAPISPGIIADLERSSRAELERLARRAASCLLPWVSTTRRSCATRRLATAI